MAFGFVLLILCIIVIKKGVVIVPEGYQFTLERLGKFERVLTPGLHIVVPFFDMVGAKLNIKEQNIPFSQQEFVTKDEYTVLIDGIITFQIMDVVKATYNIRDLYGGLLNLISSKIRSATETRTKDELSIKKSAIGYKVTESANKEANNLGVKIIRLDIQNVSLPPLDYFEKPKNYYDK